MLEIWVIILNSICMYFLTAATIVFLYCFYDNAFRWDKKKMLILLGVITLQTVVSCLFPKHWETMAFVFSIPTAVAAIYDYKGKKWTGFWRFELYALPCYLVLVFLLEIAAICFSPESVMQIVLAGDFSAPLPPEIGIVVNIGGTLFFALAFLCLYPLYRKGISIRCGKREFWVLFLVALVSLMLCTVVGYGILAENINALCFALGVVVIVVAFLFPYLIYSSRVSQYYRKRTALQEEHIQAELKNFQQYQQMQEETSRFRHDIRNNLLCVSDMLQQGKTEEAEQYLKDLLEITKKSTKRYVTGDNMLDSIIGVKAELMEQNNIRFELDGVLAGGLPWKPMDICNVFANALDNAIEACQKVDPEKRSITMSVKSTPQFWFVAIENSAAKKIDVSKIFQKNAGYTSKSNVAKHGLGTYNMKHTVESNGAMLKAESTEEIFKLEIAIDKSSPE